MKEALESQGMLIIYDQECMMCSSFISFIDKCLANCSNPPSIASSLNQSDLSLLDIDQSQLSYIERIAAVTIVVISGKRVYIKSAALGLIFANADPAILRLLSKILLDGRLDKILDIAYDVLSSHRLLLSSLFRKKCCIP